MDIVIDKYLYEKKKILESNLKIVDKCTWNDRIETCKSCEFYENYENNTEIFKCNKCGCAGFNFLLQDSQCPLKPSKWKN
jgi:hypothetical protein